MSNQKRSLALSFLVAASAFGQAGGIEKVIIQAAKPYDKVISAIRARGGTVTRQYQYVDAIAAEVPQSALAELRATAGVIAMTKDNTIQVGPVRDVSGSKGFGAAQPAEATPDGLNPLSQADISALAANAKPAAYTVNNSLMGLDPLHQAGVQGNGIVVAVIDTGIRPGFPHIAGSVIGGEDLVGDGNGYSNFANNGHGTFVSGMIAAHVGFLFSSTSAIAKAVKAYAPGAIAAYPPNPALTLIPMIGTAPAAKIYAIRVLGVSGSGSDSTVMAGVERAIQLREMYNAGVAGGQNIRVCNMSLGGPTVAPGIDAGDQLIDALLAHDIVPVIAAGNAGPAPLTIGSPATSNSALAVGAANLAHNERIAAEVTYGPGIGTLYRPFSGALMSYFSSRGPDANGVIRPNVVANGWANFGMGLGGTTSTISWASGTSFASPTVAGIAADLRQAFPNATARQIRNAIILSANPNMIAAADVLDQGAGFVNATAARDLLAAGTAPDTLPAIPKATSSVTVNVEQSTAIKVASGFVKRSFTLQPGQRREIVYNVVPNTAQVIVSLSNFAAGATQNALFGDDLVFAIHSAKTSSIGEGDYLFFGFERNKSVVVNNPETGLIRIAVDGDWTNAGNVSVDVSVVALTDPIPQFTSQGKIVTTQSVAVPFTVPAGTGQADLRLSWRQDWGAFPAADIDLILVSPTNKLNFGGATLSNPETVSISKPEVGTWLAIVDGFSIPAGSDKYELRIALDGNVIR